MSTRHTGNRHEETACWYYTHKGYSVWSPAWGGRGFGRFRSTDIFGIFDVIAANDIELVFIQVKTAKYFLKEVEEQVKSVTLPKNAHKEYWLFCNPDFVKVRRYGVDVSEYKVDLINMENI